MGPVVPFLSDSPAQLDAAVRRVAEAGATHVSPIVLHLRPGTREWFISWLHTAHPELTGRYEELYRRGAYAPKEYQARIAGQVRELADKYGVGRGTPREARAIRSPADSVGSRPAESSPQPAGTPPEPPAASPSADTPAPPADHEQLTLL
jgi:hypothetical protein